MFDYDPPPVFSVPFVSSVNFVVIGPSRLVSALLVYEIRSSYSGLSGCGPAAWAHPWFEFPFQKHRLFLAASRLCVSLMFDYGPPPVFSVPFVSSVNFVVIGPSRLVSALLVYEIRSSYSGLFGCEPRRSVPLCLRARPPRALPNNPMPNPLRHA
jgi:hypothetical protein